MIHRQYSHLKAIYHKRTIPPLSKVRRINKVFPPGDAKMVAITFDDGPTCASSRPLMNEGITESILQAMAAFDATGTFDVIGSTQENYPDRCGKPGTFKWGGVKFDHYPQFGIDSLAGAANQKELVNKILSQGHEISNHGYRHVAFGPERIIYNSRAHFSTKEQVLEDLRRLHNLIKDEFGYKITLARPPHYIDRIPDGTLSYDIYEEMGYQYLGASFDGAGWRASTGDLRKDVNAMVQPLKKALECNPDSLNGHIIFEKDGYNMSLEAPVVYALPEKLKLLKAYGYKVVSASRLLEKSQFEDVDPSSEVYKPLVFLTNLGKPVVYRDNTFRGSESCKTGEMRIWLNQSNQKPHSLESGDGKSPLTLKTLSEIAGENGFSVPATWQRILEEPVPRWQAVLVAAEILA